MRIDTQASVILTAALISCTQPKALPKSEVNIANEIQFNAWLNSTQFTYYNDLLENFNNSERMLQLGNGKHPELLVYEKTIQSKRASWKHKFPYEIHPVYENTNIIILISGSQIDRLRIFSTVSFQWWVIRKSDGEIIDSINFKNQGLPLYTAVISDNFYLFSKSENKLWKLRLK